MSEENWPGQGPVPGARGTELPRGVRALCLSLVWAWGCAASQTMVEGQEAAAEEGQELLRRGLSLEHMGRLVSAEQYLVAARQAGADARDVLPALVRVCLDAARPTRALEHTRDALRRAPTDAQLWTLAAALAWGLGRTPEADRYLRQAGSLPSPPAETTYWQGRVAAREGRLADAARSYSAYLALAPTGPFAERARFWLSVESLGDRATPLSAGSNPAEGQKNP